MRVLHVCSGLDPRAGGPPAVVVGLTRSQARAGLKVRVASTWLQGADNRAADALRADGVGVTLIGPAHGPLQRHPALPATLENLVADTDVVHIHAVWEEIQHRAARACQRHGVPYVVTPHGMLDPWSLAQKRLKKRLYMAWRLRKNLRDAAGIHCTSQTEAADVTALRIGRQVFVEPFGVDLEEFRCLPQSATFRSRYGIGADKLLITFLGRIHPGKGLEYLVPALAKLNRADVALAVVGPDSHGFRATIEAMVAANGLDRQVIFTGMLRGQEKIAALAESDLFALPSEHENFGMAVVEALAAGCPVLVTDHVGVSGEIAAAGVGGIVPLDAEGLAAGLRRWIDDRQLREEAARRARPFAMQTYDWKRIAGNWVERYQAIWTSLGRLAVAGSNELNEKVAR